MSQAQISTIVFDIGNVILYFDNHKISQKIASMTNRSESEIYEHIISVYNERGLDVGHITGVGYLAQIGKDFGLKLSRERLGEIFCDIFSENKEMLQLIESLKMKYRLAAFSNTNELHFPYIQKKYPIINEFNTYILSYKEGVKKPDIKIYETVLKRLECNPEEVLFIDDQLRNLHPASLLGMKVHHYTDHQELRFALHNFGILLG